MYRVSDLLGKPLLDISEAKFLGTICNIRFDDKMSKGLFVKLYTDDEETKYFPLNKLVNITGDAATVKSDEGLCDEAEGTTCPINSYAFDQDGKLLGKVTDIIMDGAKLTAFLLGESSINANKLLAAGNVLVFNNSGKVIKLKQAKKPLPPPKPVLPIKTAFAPSYDFLLGKKLQRTIMAVDGKVIAKEGENITGDIISEAKREGKLVILALNAL